jgi:hypothetical protein
VKGSNCFHTEKTVSLDVISIFSEKAIMKGYLIRNFTVVVVTLAGSLLLSACGGGGGGGTPSDQTVSLVGVAAKGILKGAKATAYEYKNGAWVEIKEVTTGSDGSYSFTGLPSTTNPVKVDVSVVAGTTKMLDESQVESGAYKEVDAPAGLTIRTMVEKLDGDRADINANPFTEMAVQAALTAKDENGVTLPPSPRTWAAAKSQVMTLLPAGVTPESIKPLAPSDTPTAAQASVMTLLTGLAASQDIVAAINEMKSAFALEIKADGTAVVPQANQSAVKAKFAALNTAGLTKLTALATASPNLKFISFKDESTDYNAKTFVSKDLASEEARNSLASFIDTMKVGLEATDGKISKLGKAFDERVTPLVFDLANDVLGGVTRALDEVDVDFAADGSLTLTPSCGQACQFSFTKEADGSYSVAPKNNQTFSKSAKVTGSQSADKSAKFSYSGSATSVSTGKEVMDFSVTLSATDPQQFDVSGSGVLTVESVSITAFDDAGEKSASLVISNATLTASNNGDSIALKGNVSLSTSMGDELSGTLATTSIGAEDPYGRYEDVGLTLEATLTGKLNSVNVAAISVKATNTTAAADYFNDDKQTGVIALTIKFLGESPNADVTAILTLTEALEGESTKASIKGSLAAGGNTINVEEDDVDSRQGRLSLASSSGEFKLILDNDNGDLLKGSTKIGEVKNGVLFYDGVEQSLF